MAKSYRLILNTFNNFKNSFAKLTYLKGKFLPFDLHPLFIINTGLILGISWWTSAIPWLMPVGILVVYSGLSLLLKKTHSIKPIAIIFLSFITGATLYALQLSRVSTFEAKVAGISEFQGSISAIQRIESLQFNYRIAVHLKKENANILIFTRKLPPYLVGDYISLENLTLTPLKNEKFRHYLLKENFLGCAYAHALQAHLIERPRFSFARLQDSIKKRVQNNTQAKMTAPAFSLWQTLFLGEKASKSEMSAVKNSCKNWGISHYLARSGLHLMLFIFLWLTILKLVPLTFYFKQILLLLLVILYALLSSSSISFTRALITFFLYKFCVLQHLEIRPLHMVNMACFITLLYNPATLFYLDFQLSYALTAAVTLYQEITIRRKVLH